ncbi:MAG: hypothetical protein NT144_08565 [Bacteroidia bacterium]|nr:hypothetical protein [Bacteroidia bacterium]
MNHKQKFSDCIFHDGKADYIVQTQGRDKQLINIWLKRYKDSSLPLGMTWRIIRKEEEIRRFLAGGKEME